VAKITFTGGTEAGRHILKLAAKDIKSVVMELGGHSPMIVAAAEGLEFGTVDVNNVSGGDVPFPYPGWKHSGLGVELGNRGLEEYLGTKHVRIEIGYG